MNPTPVRSWRLVWLVWACGVAAAVQVGKAPPSLPNLIQSIDLSLTQAGWVASAISLMGVFLGVLAGRISDTYGARRTLITGLLVIGFASLLGSFSRSFTDLVASRALEGIGVMILMASAPPLMQRHAPDGQQGMAMGIWGAFMPFGVAAILLIAPHMISLASWRPVWWLASAWALCTAAVAWFLLPVDPAAHPRGRLWHDLQRVFARRSIAIASSCFGLYSACYLAVLSFFPVWLIETHALPIQLAAALAAVYAMSNLVGNLVCGHLIRAGWRPWMTMRLGSLVMATAPLVMFWHAAPLWLVLLVSVTFSGFGGLLPSSTFALVTARSPSAGLVGVSNGLVLHFLSLGQLLGPPLLATTVSGLGGWGSAPLMLTGLSLTAVALTFGLARLIAAER